MLPKLFKYIWIEELVEVLRSKYPVQGELQTTPQYRFRTARSVEETELKVVDPYIEGKPHKLIDDNEEKKEDDENDYHCDWSLFLVNGDCRRRIVD